LQRFGHSADQFGPCFTRHPQRTAASQYIEALFNHSERKSMQAMHGRLSDPVSYEALQHFITDSPWKTPALWAQLRALVPVRSGILGLDDTSFLKQGKHSVGVKRQYCGALGKVANCQVAVSTVLFGAELAWPLSFELYLPKEWLTDPARRRKARIPDHVRAPPRWR
jgi:SRSO17 transposase